MTTISSGPTPLFPGAAALTGGLPATSLPAGASFADTLLSLLGRALVETPGQPDDRFAAGTMKSSVEMFDEHGFFEDRAPIEQQEPESPLASGSATAPVVFQPPFPPAAALPSLQSDPTSPLVSVVPDTPPTTVVPTGMLASDEAVGSQGPIAGGDPEVPPQSGTTRHILASAAPFASVPAPRLRAAAMMIEDPTPQERPPRVSLYHEPSALAASRVKVSLDHGDAGVAVSIVADVEPDGNAGAIHDAVSRMLARHGLVLSELRVTRRPGADGQDRKD